MKPIALLSAAAGALILAGCATPHTFHTPGPGWLSHTGQLRYSTAERSVIGGAVVSYLPVHSFHLNVFAGPGFPLIKVREDAAHARAEGALAGRSWQGEPGSEPPRLRSWFALHEVFNKLAAHRWHERPRIVRSLTPGLWEAEVSGKGRKPVNVDVRFPASGERFQFVFQNPG